jgi:hypothetical protein
MARVQEQSQVKKDLKKVTGLGEPAFRDKVIVSVRNKQE